MTLWCSPMHWKRKESETIWSSLALLVSKLNINLLMQVLNMIAEIGIPEYGMRFPFLLLGWVVLIALDPFKSMSYVFSHALKIYQLSKPFFLLRIFSIFSIYCLCPLLLTPKEKECCLSYTLQFMIQPNMVMIRSIFGESQRCHGNKTRTTIQRHELNTW